MRFAISRHFLQVTSEKQLVDVLVTVWPQAGPRRPFSRWIFRFGSCWNGRRLNRDLAVHRRAIAAFKFSIAPGPGSSQNISHRFEVLKRSSFSEAVIYSRLARVLLPAIQSSSNWW